MRGRYPFGYWCHHVIMWWLFAFNAHPLAARLQSIALNLVVQCAS